MIVAHTLKAIIRIDLLLRVHTNYTLLSYTHLENPVDYGFGAESWELGVKRDLNHGFDVSTVAWVISAVFIPFPQSRFCKSFTYVIVLDDFP